VIEIVPPPVEVTGHVVYHDWCTHCQQWREATLDVSAEVVGQGRIGVKVATLIAYLRTVMRLSLRAKDIKLNLKKKIAAQTRTGKSTAGA
jgi:hypothetical protein